MGSMSFEVLFFYVVTGSIMFVRFHIPCKYEYETEATKNVQWTPLRGDDDKNCG